MLWQLAGGRDDAYNRICQLYDTFATGTGNDWISRISVLQTLYFTANSSLYHRFIAKPLDRLSRRAVGLRGSPDTVVVRVS